MVRNLVIRDNFGISALSDALYIISMVLLSRSDEDVVGRYIIYIDVTR